jgi:poly(A) polymerase
MMPDRALVDQLLALPLGRQAYHVVETLHDAGHESWWVGGAIRDLLLGQLPTDIDIATAAEPSVIAQLFPGSDATDSALGAVRITREGVTLEVTTFREDDEASDGRHPESVRFGTREDDAKRRDLTLSALYWQPITRELWDPCNGQADLRERLVRFIGQPAVRLKHDVLRHLRAIRARATIDGQYEPETYTALRETTHLLSTLSGERVRSELEKLLACPRPDLGLRDWWDLRVCDELLPELSACKGIAQPRDYHHEGDVFEHLLQCCRSFQPDHTTDVRLAALFHDISKPQTFSLAERIHFDEHATASADIAKQILTRWQLPRRRIEKIDWLIRHHMHMSFLELSDERKAHWYFHPWFAELLQLFWLDVAGTTPSDFSLIEAIEQDRHHFLDQHPRPAVPLLTGEEVMTELGLRPGAEVGRILRELLEAQTKGAISQRQEALTFIRHVRPQG